MTAKTLLATLVLAGTACVALVAQAPKPANGWPAATLESQQLDPAPLRDIVSKAQAGTFGNSDRLVVIRNGKLLLDEHFNRDYREISRGKSSPIGCGIDACKDSSQINHYNYLYPTFHPFWQGMLAE